MRGSETALTQKGDLIHRIYYTDIERLQEQKKGLNQCRKELLSLGLKKQKGGKRDLLRGQATNSVTGTMNVKATTSEAVTIRRCWHMKDLGLDSTHSNIHFFSISFPISYGLDKMPFLSPTEIGTDNSYITYPSDPSCKIFAFCSPLFYILLS